MQTAAMWGAEGTDAYREKNLKTRDTKTKFSFL